VLDVCGGIAGAGETAQIAPFLTYDSDSRTCDFRGALIWFQDGYTISQLYPYSTPSLRAASTTSAIRWKVTIFCLPPPMPTGRHESAFT